MKELLPSASAASENFIMTGSTHAMGASDNLAVNVKGYNPAHNFGRQVRLMYLFSAEMKRPVYSAFGPNGPEIKSISYRNMGEALTKKT
jgi:hypothetical protein